MQEFFNNYWQPALYTVLTGVISYLANRLRCAICSVLKRQQIYESALLAIMYDRLFQACQQHLERGNISTPELKNLEHLYTNYHQLGGNGTGTELYNRCLDLPLKETLHD